MAYEAATADLKGRQHDRLPFHLEAYGEKAVNYNRDLEVFPVVKRIIEKITGEESEYKSPTDMGVNRAGFCITNDEVVREAANQEIIRRYMIAQCDYKKGKISGETVERAKLLMDDLSLCVEDRKVVAPARDYAEQKKACNERYANVVVMALELPDGTIITGRSSRRMVAAAAAVLNAIKYLSGMADDLYLISPGILKSIQELKVDVLGAEKTSLNCEEILTALTISAVTNPSAARALAKVPQLKSCRAHCTAILSDKDESTLKGARYRRDQRSGILQTTCITARLQEFTTCTDILCFSPSCSRMVPAKSTL